MNGLEEVVKACRYLLNNSPEAEEYLTYLNGRVGPEVQEEFEFGYLPGAKNLNLLTSFISEERLKELKLLSDYTMQDSVSARVLHYCFFEHHPLIMPFKDIYGRVVGLVGRTLLGDEDRELVKIPKYKNTGDKFKKGNHVFGLFEAKRAILEKDFVYVVEGQFDVIKAREKGIHNIVALGNCNIGLTQLTLICRYTKNIFLLLDNDAAGEKGRSGAVKKFGQVANITNIYLPFGYKDIDEFLKDNPGDSLPFVVKNVKYSL